MNPLTRAAFVSSLILASAVTAQTRWSTLAPANSPSPRGGHKFVMAGPSGGIVFGGQNASTYMGDTWSWNGNDWTQLTPVSSPPNRAHYAMCYDPTRNRVVLFSGWTGGSYPADTWEYDGTTWAQITTATFPPGRDWAAMEFDPISGRSILYGGHDWVRSTNGLPNYDDTWSWDGTTWTQLQPNNVPPHRWGHVMVYHAARGTIVLHGGTAGTDTWEWTGTDWAQIPTANAPARRTRPGAAYDYQRARMVLWGGSGSGGIVSDTWEFNGVDWVQRAPLSPPVSDTGGMFDPTRQEIVNFGGALVPNRSSTSNATDSYGPLTPATSRSFGNGCAGTAGTPTMDSSKLAWVGTVYDVGVRSVPANGSVFFVHGFSNSRTAAGLPLPFSLGAVGMTGCSLYVDPSVTIGTTANAGGEARMQLGVPSMTNLVGVAFFGQALVVSPGTNWIGLVASDASEHVFGGL